MKRIISFLFSLLFIISIGFCQEISQTEPTQKDVFRELNSRLSKTIRTKASQYFISNVTGINRDEIYNNFTKYDPNIELIITSFANKKIDDFNCKSTVDLTIKLTGSKNKEFYGKLFVFFVRDEKNLNDPTWYLEHFELAK